MDSIKRTYSDVLTESLKTPYSPTNLTIVCKRCGKEKDRNNDYYKSKMICLECLKEPATCHLCGFNTNYNNLRKHVYGHMIDANGYKTCRICNMEKNNSFFRTGYMTCKQCIKQKRRIKFNEGFLVKTQ